MKPFLSLFFAGLLYILCTATLQAVPAYHRERQCQQPDGSRLTLVGRGDEFCHFLTTTDGYTLLRDADGYYCYAVMEEGGLVASTVHAHDVAQRSAAELEFLSSQSKYLTPVERPAAASLRGGAARRGKSEAATGVLRAAAVGQNDYRGLFILIDYNDRSFSRGDEEAARYYDHLMNEPNFRCYEDPMHGPQLFTGSVHDYFSDNSNGKFAPQFDIVGPIHLDVSQCFVKGITNAYDLQEMALRKADELVDFTRYDSDGDGELDMVYLLYAGYSSHYSGNDERYLWPHAGKMSDGGKELYLDGIHMGRFACSSEFWGWEEDRQSILDGIGVIVHEFSHVLGFMDHYDTSNGYQEHPSCWDVMAAGNYSDDYNRTPVAYNSYEKYVAGFIQPLDITHHEGETFTLRSNELTHDACMLRSYQDDVFFLMENRQYDKWDTYLPGYGMCVWRVDSTNVDYWKYNYINVTTRACFRLVRACGTQGSFLTGVEDTDFDPFPGTHQITELDNDEDAANLISYDGYPCPVVLRNIREQRGVISFDVVRDEEARNAPITYAIPSRFTAHAERLVGDEWVPVSWTVRGHAEGDNLILTNLLPNHVGITSTSKDYSRGITLTYSMANASSHTAILNAQRLVYDSQSSTWFCDLNDVEAGGAGGLQFSIGRYGIPQLLNPDTRLAYCVFKPKAVIASQKNLLAPLDVYRNITFTDYDPDAEVQAIAEVTEDNNPARPIKVIEGGHIYIVCGNQRYSLSGQTLK